MNEIPNPGSDAAHAAGCVCPTIDNAHGKGARGTSGPDALFYIMVGCPLHSPLNPPAGVAGE